MLGGESAGQQPNTTLLDYLIILRKRQRLIVCVTTVAVVLTAVVSLLLPKVFRAETRILPNQQGPSGTPTQLMSQLGSFGVSPGMVGMKSTNDLYIGLIKGRTILDRMVERFMLLDVYHVKYREDARRELLKSLKLQDGKKSGIITIGVEDRDPQRSADMANAIVEELKNATQNLALSEASQRRLFFEGQLKSVKEALTRSEEALKGYQERTGTIEIKEQAKVAIESVARLRAQIAAKEVELKVLKTHATRLNPDRQHLEEELQGMREQLSKLQGRTGANSEALMPTGKMPSAATGSVRKLRDLKYNESLYELLTRQYELAKIDEARDAMLIQVLDKAIPPEKKIKPDRKIMIATAAFTSLFSSILAAFFLEYRGKYMGIPGNKEKLEQLKKGI